MMNMKLKFQIIVLLLLTVTLSAFVFDFFKEPADKKAIKDNVFFVVTGFGEEGEDISLTDLRGIYCSGNLYVLSSVYKEVQDYFEANGLKNAECLVPIPLESMNEFSLLAKNKIMITDLEHLSSTFKVLSVDGINFQR